MSVELWVEEDLDAQILFAFLQGAAAVRSRGGKDTLRPQVLNQRRHSGTSLLTPYYLRDRDFDHLPEDSAGLTPDSDKSDVLGWRWHRHEIENYLLEPAIFEAAMGRTDPPMIG